MGCRYLWETLMSFMKTILGSAAAAALSATAALADPAIIFDLGGKFDKSFNEAAFQGAQRWADETGGSFREIELQNEAQREQALRRFAEAGSNPIVMAGFAFSDALSKVAPDYPDTKFAVIDVNWLRCPTYAASVLTNMKAPTLLVCWQLKPRQRARSALLVAWIFH